MTLRTLTREEARRIAVRAALLDAREPSTLVETVRELAGLRIELTSTVAAAQDHALWNRLGATHRPDDTWRALADGRLFERDWMLRPMGELGLYLAGMRTFLDRAGGRDWVEANREFRQRILDRLADEGPLTSREVPDESQVPWFSTGWTRDQNVTKMLQLMHQSGDLAVIGHRGRLRVFDLAENVYPSMIPEVPREEAARVRAERLLGVFGVWRDGASRSHQDLHDVPPVGELVEIEGVSGRWRVDPTATAEGFAGRCVILSPADRLVFDRERLGELCGFEYVLEMYKPKASRRFGPNGFALPILRGDRLIGTVDARSEPKKGTVTVNQITEAAPWDAAEHDDVDVALAGLASALHLELVRADR